MIYFKICGGFSMSVLGRDLKIIAFPGAPNLPFFVARSLGFLAEAGVGVRFETTPSSVYQFEQFGSGDFDLAFTAFDNVVAYREGQGAAKLAEFPDFRAISVLRRWNLASSSRRTSRLPRICAGAASHSMRSGPALLSCSTT
jgi:hypothetical protein